MSEVYAGRLALVKVDLAGVGGAAANWATIGQQRGLDHGRTTETADASHKGDNGWANVVITRIGWTLNCDGALDPADTVLQYLQTQWMAKAKIWVQFDPSLAGGTKMEGRAVLTDFSLSAPDGDLITFTASFQGAGALSTSP
jgi:hypothetical protein